MRRRINLIPFTVWIPEEERDKELENKLRAEMPGIMRWAVAGCLDWQRIGLRPPQIVTDATKEYLDAEDVIARWIDDCCICGKQFETPSSILFKNYQAWCEHTGERARSQKKLSQTLSEKGFRPGRSMTARSLTGIALREQV
jgi:putative DNA primase/helicase